MSYIYAYAKESLMTHQDAKWNNAIKVGYTSRTPEARIKEQDGTAEPEPLILLKAWPIDPTLGEFDVVVHRILEQQGFRPTRTDAQREWYTITASTKDERLTIIHEAIQLGSKDPNAARHDLALTPSQYEMLEQALIRFTGGDRVLIAELCARFGKTLWALCLLSALPERVMVVSTYWLSALTSFRAEVAKFTQFVNLRYVDAADDNYATKMEKHLADGYKVVVGVSLHAGENRREVKKEDLQPIVNIADKLVFVDEADFGAWQPNQRELIEFLTSSTAKLILATGTNAARAATGRKIDHHLCVTYFDMLLTKRGGSKYVPSLGLPFKMATDLSSLPDVEFYQLAFPNIVDQTIMNKDNMPLWGKAFEDPHKAKGFLRSCFGALFNGEGVYEFMNMDNIFGVRPTGVMIWLPEGGKKTNVDKFAVMLQEWIPEWMVYALHGDVTDNRNAEQEVKNLHQRALREGKNGVVVVSIKMGSRSFSVPEIDTTILAYDNGSAAQTAQKSSRVLTRGAPGKIGRVLSLSLDPTRADQLDVPILETAQKLADKDKIDIAEAIKIVLRTLNVFTMDTEIGERITIDVDHYTEKVLSQNSLTKIVAKTADIAVILQDPDMVAKILQISASPNIISSPEKTIEKGKKFLNKGSVDPRVKPDDNEERELLSTWLKVEKAIKALVDNMPFIAYLAPQDNTVKSILASTVANKQYAQIFEEEFGVAAAFVYRLIEDEVISDHLLNLSLRVQRKEDMKTTAQFWV